jgi:Big-like domain-containing protein
VPHGTVIVTFNLAVDPATASQPANYAVDEKDSGDPARVFNAQVSPDDPATVLVTADLLPKTKYTVTVSGVLSTKQQPLVPGKVTADFTTKSDPNG